MGKRWAAAVTAAMIADVLRAREDADRRRLVLASVLEVPALSRAAQALRLPRDALVADVLRRPRSTLARMRRLARGV